jgi:hypothetical protein
VIGPLLRELGYRTGTDSNIVRELDLRYPHSYIGRKDTKKDPVLRGKADYVLEIGQRIRWVLEAKAPGVDIAAADQLEQARSYAAHPEVAAVYFVLCNGARFLVYDCAEAPGSPPLLDLAYEDLPSRFGDLRNALAPAAMLRAFPDRRHNFSPAIGIGLSAIARITNGVIRFRSVSVESDALKQLRTFIVGGSVQRDENGRLVAHMATEAPIREIQDLCIKLGMNEFEMTCPDSILSSNPSAPSVFLYEARLVIPAGYKVVDVNTWKTLSFPIDLSCRTRATASGTLDSGVFQGAYSSIIEFDPIMQVRSPPMSIEGDFTISLA